MIKEYKDKRMCYLETDNGFKEWWDYDEYGNCIHYKNSSGFECFRTYDENGNILTHKDNE